MITEYSLLPPTQSIWQICFEQSTTRIPFYSYAWHEAYFSTLGKNETPYILFLPELSIIAPLVKKNNMLMFSGGTEVTDYLDIIGPNANKIAAWDEVIMFLKKKQISEIVLQSVPEFSPTRSYFESNKKNHALQIQIHKKDTTPILTLPKQYDQYKKGLSRKLRHELERKIRKFERENPTVESRKSANPVQDITVLLDLMKKNEAKREFLTSEKEAFFHTLVKNFPDEIVVFITYVEGFPAAAILAFKSSESFLLYNSGFDNKRFPGAGFYVNTKSILFAIEQGFTHYNFLRGNERYKYDLGGKDLAVYDVSVRFTS